ncbi:ABC transporter permease [Rubripirellula sp.]|nr:ABC transporter permease [Rubripirellula sp.]MDB4338913.1 ABC transporter permease [Rubripirellula sp.]
MIPYLAVLRDSFRAAFASRVLWIAFVAIWILLSALAPIGYREEFTTQFRPQDFYNGTRLKAMLAQGLVDPEVADQPIGRIAAAMPEDLAKQLRRVGEGDEVRILLRVLAGALNLCLDEESWFDRDAWKETLQFRELRELEAMSDPLEESLRRRRARLRLEVALPGVFETRAARSIRLTYAGLDFPANFSTDKTQFLILLNQYVLPVIIEWLMGFVLVFLGILVTASMIPEMLQPGSLHLLLSKPVSRSLLLISKFVGGCAFVFLCVSQLVAGLYLIAGLRLDIWNLGLLWCIPVSVFLFSVFYSVSTFAGLVWRSPILSIGVTSIFGSICLVGGIIGGLFDGLVTRPHSLRNIAVVGDVLMGNTLGGGLVWWNDKEGGWTEIFETNPLGADRVIPPVALNSSAVATARVRGGRLNPFGSGAPDLLVLTEDSGWIAEPSLRLPAGTTSLYRVGSEIIALNGGELASASLTDVLELAGAEKQLNGEQEPDDGLSGSGDASGKARTDTTGWLSKLSTMMGGVTEGFQKLLPPQVSLAPPRSLAFAEDGSFLIVFSRGRLMRFDSAGGESENWNLTANELLEGEASQKGLVAISGETLIVARDDSPLVLCDIQTLQQQGSVSFSDSLTALFVLGIPTEPEDEDRFLLGTSDGRIRQVIWSPDTTELRLSGPIGPTEVECVEVDADKQVVYVAHHIDQIDLLGLADFERLDRRKPQVSSWRLVDRYVISPLRMIIPQTGELGESIEAIISGESAKTVLSGPNAGEVVRYNLIRPITSCSLFIVVMLITSCYYFTTRDF